jgi:hypothetical protein
MSKFHVIDTISELGCSNGENEDCFGWNHSAVFVIDGATPLGPPLITPPHSDAAWLAEFARDFFVRELSSNSSGPETVRSLNKAARDYFFAHVHQEVEPYQYPAAGFQALRILEEGLETMGLADCVLFVQDAQNQCTRWTGGKPNRLPEQQAARRALDLTSGFKPSGGPLQDDRVLIELRLQRSVYNTPEGSWTLGLEPAAADHVIVQNLKTLLPATAILCTDGFAEMVDHYAIHTIDSIIARAEKEGLARLLIELRHMERHLDPDGSMFPRYKQSDDATAVLICIRE